MKALLLGIGVATALAGGGYKLGHNTGYDKRDLEATSELAEFRLEQMGLVQELQANYDILLKEESKQSQLTLQKLEAISDEAHYLREQAKITVEASPCTNLGPDIISLFKLVHEGTGSDQGEAQTDQ